MDGSIGGVAETGLLVKWRAGECRRPIGFFDGDHLVGVRRCLCWKCESCVGVLRRSLYARLMEGTSVRPPVALLTFTVRRLPEWTVRELGLVLATGWRRWLSRLRQLGARVGFFRVVEFHRSGVPHLHVLVTGRIPCELLSGFWNRVVKSSMTRLRGSSTCLLPDWVGTVDAKWVAGGSGRVVGYLLKYLTKGVEGWRQGCGFVRRWGASRGFLPASLLFARRPSVPGGGGDRRVLSVRRVGRLDRQALVEEVYRVENCLETPMDNVSHLPCDYFLSDSVPDGSAGLPGGQRKRRRADKRRKSLKTGGLYGATLLSEIYPKQSDWGFKQRDDPDGKQGAG